jgi:hypothetical protein
LQQKQAPEKLRSLLRCNRELLELLWSSRACCVAARSFRSFFGAPGLAALQQGASEASPKLRTFLSCSKSNLRSSGEALELVALQQGAFGASPKL